MIVITHHGISAKINRENAGQFQQAVFNPLSAMFVTVAGEGVFTTQESAAYATR